MTFTPPEEPYVASVHHQNAAKGNVDVTTRALSVLDGVLSGTSDFRRILLRAAAGAGKSFALRRMVEHALEHEQCSRVAVVAFANKQIFPLAEELGRLLGKDYVVLLVSRARIADVPVAAARAATVVSTTKEIPGDTKVVIATSHRLGLERGRLLGHLGHTDQGGTIFDVLFVDEAWQLPLYLYRGVEYASPLSVGVGDVGQLPPLVTGENPWQGDPGYNPYRAWPSQYERDKKTWSMNLPAVWRPTAEQLPLWRSFYLEWDELTCVAAPGDRSVDVDGLSGAAKAVWGQVATGIPTLVEIEGLDEPDAPDVDLPLLEVVEKWLGALLAKGFLLAERPFNSDGSPKRRMTATSSTAPGSSPMIVVLATRNQAVDDATDMVDRLTEAHGLTEGVIVASTVDSWQGQTNGITVAIHPLSGASALDDFNSAFGRLAVTCTRATHGLLIVSRSGLSELLSDAPARPGTPFGEPGNRQLPRQTHERILKTFARATLTV